MKITFTVSDCKSDRYHYECSELGDMSGDYYPAAEVELLVEAAKAYQKYNRIKNDSDAEIYELMEAALAPFTKE